MKELNEKEEEKVTGGRRNDNYDFGTVEDLENSPIFQQLKNKLIEIKNSVDFTTLNNNTGLNIAWKLKKNITENGYTVSDKAIISFVKKYWDLI